MKITRNDKSKSRKNACYSDRYMSKGITNGFGISIVALTLVVSIIGVHTSIEAMQAHALQMQYVYQQEAMNQNQSAMQNTMMPDDFSEKAVLETIVPETTIGASFAVDPAEMDSWTSVQIEWMRENHITWNDLGLPVNEFGEVVDDPTTAIDETERASKNVHSEQTNSDEQKKSVETNLFTGGTESDIPVETTETSSEIETVSESETELESSENTPAPADRWWDAVDMMIIVEDGQPYYVVEEGNCLGDIARISGYSLSELISYNHIADANIIDVGQKIMFPSYSPSNANN